MSEYLLLIATHFPVLLVYQSRLRQFLLPATPASTSSVPVIRYHQRKLIYCNMSAIMHPTLSKQQGCELKLRNLGMASKKTLCCLIEKMRRVGTEAAEGCCRTWLRKTFCQSTALLMVLLVVMPSRRELQATSPENDPSISRSAKSNISISLVPGINWQHQQNGKEANPWKMHPCQVLTMRYHKPHCINGNNIGSSMWSIPKKRVECNRSLQSSPQKSHSICGIITLESSYLLRKASLSSNYHFREV